MADGRWLRLRWQPVHRGRPEERHQQEPPREVLQEEQHHRRKDQRHLQDQRQPVLRGSRWASVAEFHHIQDSVLPLIPHLKGSVKYGPALPSNLERKIPAKINKSKAGKVRRRK
jgi:hypothetical protein